MSGKSIKDTELLPMDEFLGHVFKVLGVRDVQAAVLGKVKMQRTIVAKQIDTATTPGCRAPESFVAPLRQKLETIESVLEILQAKRLEKNYCTYDQVKQQGVPQGN